MSISDRIAILYNGTIQQIDTPRSIYQRPANVFVATFVGKANLLESELIFDGKDTTLRLPIGCEIKLNSVKNEYKKNQKVITVIRPADFIISTDSNTKIRAIIDDSMFLGSSTYYFAHFDTGHKVEFVKESEFGKSSLTESDTVYLSVKKKNINVFTEDGNINILKEGDADDKYKTEESV
jgi:iron(III) transport system ATP-binding protein